MISSFALVLMGAMAATPCENLKTVELKQATITAADFVPEGAAPARGGGGGSSRRPRRRCAWRCARSSGCALNRRR